jgi:sugar/nucleoside kinase (ribokinase family)
MTPDILIAGHIAKDRTATGWRPGGGVLYAAAQAARLGFTAGVVTACSAELRPADVLSDVDWHVLPSEATTTFENVYEDGVRRQRLLATASPLGLQDIPRDWLDAPIVLLTSLFHEIDDWMAPALARRGALVSLGAQGWLRRLEGDRVLPMPFESSPAWLAGEAVFVSEEDLLDSQRVAEWRSQVPIVVLTRGYRGCTVWEASGRHDISAAHVEEVDPTGAGDVFAAAFLICYAEDRDVLQAARFATAAAALAVRGEGISAIAGRDEIESLVRGGRVKVA